MNKNLPNIDERVVEVSFLFPCCSFLATDRTQDVNTLCTNMLFLISPGVSRIFVGFAAVYYLSTSVIGWWGLFACFVLGGEESSLSSADFAQNIWSVIMNVISLLGMRFVVPFVSAMENKR